MENNIAIIPNTLKFLIMRLPIEEYIIISFSFVHFLECFFGRIVDYIPLNIDGNGHDENNEEKDC